MTVGGNNHKLDWWWRFDSYYCSSPTAVTTTTPTTATTSSANVFTAAYEGRLAVLQSLVQAESESVLRSKDEVCGICGGDGAGAGRDRTISH